MDRESQRRQLAELKARVERLEAELAEDRQLQWPPESYYTAYHVLAGFVLGMFGAATSLLFNIVGSLIIGQHPLRIIQVYLTFPLGKAPLEPGFDNNLALAVGCCLYLGTGMLLGIPFQVVLSRWLPGATFLRRFAAVSALAIVAWLINFYGILAWLQPTLFGGSWIVEQIPWWVGASTHLVFGWTMLLVQPMGRFVPFGHKESA